MVDTKNIATVGITDHAQNALGDVVYVDVPEKGKTVKQKAVLSAVESVKAASGIYLLQDLSLDKDEFPSYLLDNTRYLCPSKWKSCGSQQRTS